MYFSPPKTLYYFIVKRLTREREVVRPDIEREKNTFEREIGKKKFVSAAKRRSPKSTQL